MKLTYWVADCLDDSRCYSIRGKTRKEVLAELAKEGLQLTEPEDEEDEPCYHDSCGRKYGVPRKITVEYKNGFDLLCQALCEGGIE